MLGTVPFLQMLPYAEVQGDKQVLRRSCWEGGRRYLPPDPQPGGPRPASSAPLSAEGVWLLSLKQSGTAAGAAAQHLC